MSDKSLAAAAPQRGLLSADPVGDFDGAAPRVSFEFFPPKTPEMEARLWEVDQTARIAGAALRLRYLRSRRLDPRAHPRDRAPDPQ